MLQALLNKSIDTKAISGAKGKANAAEVGVDPESMLEGADFANELMASLVGESSDPQVNPIQVGSDQQLEIPSQLLKLANPQTSPEGVNPKLFDSSLTKDVANIIQPKTTTSKTVVPQQAVLDQNKSLQSLQESLTKPMMAKSANTSETSVAEPVELTESQMLQVQHGSIKSEAPTVVPTDLKINPSPVTSQESSVSKLLNNVQSHAQTGLITAGVVAAGADSTGAITQEGALNLKASLLEPQMSPSMMKMPQVQLPVGPIAEPHPQLVNLEDFVGQKNALAKKKSVQINPYIAPGKSNVPASNLEHGLKSNQVIQDLGEGSKMAQGQSINSQQFILSAQAEVSQPVKVENTHAPVKTFDMSQLKTENADQIISQITDYIVQAKTSKEPVVNMRVNHDELGMIDITVNKMNAGQDVIGVNIGAHTQDGKNFFQVNSKELLAHLSNSGLSVTDLKVETPSQTAKNDFDMGGQSGRGSSSDRQFNSEQNQRRQESERRQDLWNLLRDKEAA